jgi:hypothetical protein
VSSRGCRKPDLAAVLAATRPGCTVRLSLSDEQKRAFRDPDGRLALDVVRHVLGARAASAATSGTFPLTEHTFQAVARKLGAPIGIKRIRGLLHHLVLTSVLVVAGSYRQAYRVGRVAGFRVTLYRALIVAPPARKASIGRRRAVKSREPRRWWQHQLFGDLHGLPPPGLSPERLRRMRSEDERSPRVWSA